MHATCCIEYSTMNRSEWCPRTNLRNRQSRRTFYEHELGAVHLPSGRHENVHLRWFGDPFQAMAICCPQPRDHRAWATAQKGGRDSLLVIGLERIELDNARK